MDEQRPDPVAAMDQAMSSVAGSAKLAWGYFKGAIDAGFTREEALALTRDYQNRSAGADARLPESFQAGQAQLRRSQD